MEVHSVFRFLHPYMNLKIRLQRHGITESLTLMITTIIALLGIIAYSGQAPKQTIRAAMFGSSQKTIAAALHADGHQTPNKDRDLQQGISRLAILDLEIITNVSSDNLLKFKSRTLKRRGAIES